MLWDRTTNLSGPLGVLSADKHPTESADPMFSINLKRSIATVAVIVGALAVTGPVSASSTPLQSSGMDSEAEFMDYTDDALLDAGRATGLKFDTDVTDYLQRHTASGIDVWGLDRRVFSADA